MLYADFKTNTHAERPNCTNIMTKYTHNEITDIAIRLTDMLVENGLVKDCTDTDDQSEFEVQDKIYEILTNALN